MFSPNIVKSEEFLSMPSTSQLLYFHLGMDADDDGFVQPRIVMRVIGAADDDLKVLLAKRFLLPFESGVVVIKHWLIHNLIQKDRYHPTRFQDEKHHLFIKENKAYTENEISVNKMLPEVRLGKDSIEMKTSSKFSPSGLESQRDMERIEIEIDEDGREVAPKRTGPKPEGKNKIAMRLQRKFVELARKNLNVSPVMDVKGYKMCLYAMNTGGLTEPQIEDLFEEWFGLGRPDEETISITRALSARQIETYKVRNDVK